ncbi:MAG: sigma-70 family RNA polymerase sigma factor [Proteobacteria bacterium]|nr:sigma-70 family RNA polymerase sigma factor [Pseudomonadota bacterium]MBU1585061.1 sigma-70 family RNA polymerase sigma factor [Pseudomonadota bacterium]MBU2455874.1 sigma-70 family RNA polymerase sigma factor [Pseudomonadota bacterium]MBU2629564.1 sigma-70 family RNA polymerase sigma factor [Pseudomonadota bacterium]
MNKSDAIADNITEQDLVERLKNGQQWAFNNLVKTYQDRLLKIAYGITLDREDSLEVVQDVFISVFKNIQTFRQDASLATWLRKITINQCLNWKRKWKRRFKWSHDVIESENDKQLFKENKKNNDPEMLFREKQFEKNLMNAIKTLPEKIRLVLVLNAFEGLSYDEIAKTLNIKKGTVSSRLHFARKSLVELLEINN